ncbi:hypothetical protein AMTRI_Chr01g133330 [Amborella trichopoda]
MQNAAALFHSSIPTGRNYKRFLSLSTSLSLRDDFIPTFLFSISFRNSKLDVALTALDLLSSNHTRISKALHLVNANRDQRMMRSLILHRLLWLLRVLIADTVAMDCEMVGVSSQGTKSALGRVTLVNAWGNVIYDEHVRPIERVVDFRSEISGIRPHNLRKAKDFWTVQKHVADLMKGRILVGHALHNDLKALLLSHPKKDTRDTSEYMPFKRDGRKSALRDLASLYLGVTIQEREHCPVEDAQAAMAIYQKHKKEWERSIKQQMRSKRKTRKKKKQSKPMDNEVLRRDHVTIVSDTQKFD